MVGLKVDKDRYISIVPKPYNFVKVFFNFNKCRTSLSGNTYPIRRKFRTLTLVCSCLSSKYYAI